MQSAFCSSFHGPSHIGRVRFPTFTFSDDLHTETVFLHTGGTRQTNKRKDSGESCTRAHTGGSRSFDEVLKRKEGKRKSGLQFSGEEMLHVDDGWTHKGRKRQRQRGRSTFLFLSVFILFLSVFTTTAKKKGERRKERARTTPDWASALIMHSHPMTTSQHHIQSIQFNSPRWSLYS